MFSTGSRRRDKYVAGLEAKLSAISRSQSVIEFDLDGTIITANENFLAVMGYRLDEVVGKHHSMFVEQADVDSAEYRSFWEQLNRGDFFARKFKRVAKSGKEIWIQASYNPLFDECGKPFRIVKVASDITAVEEERRANEEERARKAAEQSRVVEVLRHGLGSLANGDLTARVSSVFPIEYEKLKSDFNAALEKLQTTLRGVLATTWAVKTRSRELASGADDLSRRTEQQAASLAHTVTALNQVTATAAQTADSARKASASVSDARSEAERGSAIVREAVTAMKEIESSSSQMSRIIAIIDEISLQTNLLALNAGVEAARAGDAGRGFAVVANEVRALAQRSAGAAKEIKSLISMSTQQVAAGASLVAGTGSALDRIVGRVNEISTQVTGISIAAHDQSRTLAEINRSITTMGEVTQQNAGLVDETTAAVHSLAAEADRAARLTAAFRTDGEVLQRQQSEPEHNAQLVLSNLAARPSAGDHASRAPHAVRGPAKCSAAAGSKRDTAQGAR